MSWVTTTDHKRIGILYICTSLVFFAAGGILALLMRAQLAQANEHFITKQSYNELFTIHGTTMIFLVVVPIFAGFANFLVPLMIGARDVAFPRLNALSYWLFLFGGVVLYLSFFAKYGASRSGWYGYPPLSDDMFSLGHGQDLRHRVQKNPKLASGHRHAHVGHPHDHPTPPPLLRIAHHQKLPRVIRGRALETRQVGIAANHAVHDDDVGSGDLTGGVDEIHHPALDSIHKAGLAQQLGGALFIGGCQLHADRALEACLQELDLNGANAAAHFEQRAAPDALLLQKLGDAQRGRIEATTAIAPCLGVRSLLAEDRTVALR